MSKNTNNWLQIKVFSGLSGLLFGAPTLAQDYLFELRLGLQDSFHKVVEHSVQGELAGNFSNPGYGLRLGKQFDKHTLFLEYNPEQDVEIKSANELAKVSSSFVGYRYSLSPVTYLGGQIGHSSFELVNGPNGVTFTDNPETSGLTYGLNIGYRHALSEKLYLAAEGVFNLGSYKEDGPSSTNVDSIKVQYQSQLNLNFGWEI